MKKIVRKAACLALAGAMVLSLAACGSSSDASGDVDAIKKKGTFVVGITEFAPMDYKDGSDWIGFDADLAKKVAGDLGVEVQFEVIDWDNKLLELNNKNIDVVWNGMTLTDEVKTSMGCTEPYLNNAQTIVMPADKLSEYPDASSMKDLKFAVEAGSAGKDAAEANGLQYTEVGAQSDAVMEVAAGTSDACVIDLLMAGAMVGEGTSYKDLGHAVDLAPEQYVIGCRKGSDLTDYINDELKKYYSDGTMQEIAETYGVQDALIPQK